MKNFKTILLLLSIIITLPSMLASRGNPIMVIELDCFGEAGIVGPVDRNIISTRAAIPRIDCDNGTCPQGYVPFNEFQDCQCVPDCLDVEPCEDCLTPLVWQFEQGDDAGTCSCEGMPFNQTPTNINCGCPEGFIEIPTEGGPICESELVPCFEDDLEVIQQVPDCLNPVAGKIRAEVTIQTIPSTPNVNVPISAILNCDLINDDGSIIDILEFADEGALSFMADALGQIVLTFEFEQGQENIPAFIYLDEDLAQQELQLLSLDNLCPRAIPTLSTWMIIMLGLIMAISGLVFVKRKEVRTFLGLF